MILVAALVAYTLLTMFLAPLLLGRGHWRIDRPRLCLWLWFALFLSGLVSAAAAIGLAITYGIEAHLAASREDWLVPTGGTVLAWISLGLAGGLLSVVGTKLGAMIIAERKLRADFARLISTAGYRQETIAGLSVHYINSPRPLACGLRGRTAEIVVSSGLADRLSPAEVRAVIEHERAHLRGRHDLATRLAALSCACLPTLIASRELHRATLLLTELIADDAAARHCGAGITASALAKLSTGDDHLFHLRAQRLLPA
ncbi:M56 family metallopeptidase [Microlunatus parietis]|uniref:Zn-dependent protease with chaperone function n=1 Tax=Microlunatus parietis TaxID=682979 RepID=A0A7Y9LFJ3_9ACTN|nr:M56 family metallopeptidase [Microlunatus parietis]NYE75045.1 Zn-dependent protease with chaperone function [Microlunatus parietis]